MRTCWRRLAETSNDSSGRQRRRRMTSTTSSAPLPLFGTGYRRMADPKPKPPPRWGPLSRRDPWPTPYRGPAGAVGDHLDRVRDRRVVTQEPTPVGERTRRDVEDPITIVRSAQSIATSLHCQTSGSPTPTIVTGSVARLSLSRCARASGRSREPKPHRATTRERSVPTPRSGGRSTDQPG